MNGRYEIRRLPLPLTLGRYTVALFAPSGRCVARSWHAMNLKQRCEELNEAYDLGFAAGLECDPDRPAEKRSP